MPPPFPIGGMENPHLTFVSPSVLQDDKSSAYVVAHEIGHSWFGNLVTNKNWTHFWLNEGFTRYIERRIICRQYNDSRYLYQSMIGKLDLENTVRGYPSDSSVTTLFPNLYREGPDEIMSSVPYERGFFFLVYIEVT